MWHAQQLPCIAHVYLSAILMCLSPNGVHHTGSARGTCTRVPWPWPMCSTAPLITPNMKQALKNTNAHTSGSESAGCLDSSSKHRHFIWFLLPAHRWSGFSGVLREFSLVYRKYVWCSSAFVWRLLFRRKKSKRACAPGFACVRGPQALRRFPPSSISDHC